MPLPAYFWEENKAERQQQDPRSRAPLNSCWLQARRTPPPRAALPHRSPAAPRQEPPASPAHLAVPRPHTLPCPGPSGPFPFPPVGRKAPQAPPPHRQEPAPHEQPPRGRERQGLGHGHSTGTPPFPRPAPAHPPALSGGAAAPGPGTAAAPGRPPCLLQRRRPPQPPHHPHGSGGGGGAAGGKGGAGRRRHPGGPRAARPRAWPRCCRGAPHSARTRPGEGARGTQGRPRLLGSGRVEEAGSASPGRPDLPRPSSGAEEKRSLELV